MDYFKIEHISSNQGKENFERLLQQFATLCTPLFTISEIGVTHRWVTHWEKSGLISPEREGVSWRRFTFIEYVWLQVIVELRRFEVSFPIIKAFKEKVFEPYHDSAELEYIKSGFKDGNVPLPSWLPIQFIGENVEYFYGKLSCFYRCVQAAVFTREPLCLMIFKDGNFEIFDGRDTNSTVDGVQTFLSLIKNENFICINIQHILEKFYENPKVKARSMHTLSFITAQEAQILDVIRDGNFKEVLVKEKKKENVYSLKITRQYPVSKLSSHVSSLIRTDNLDEIKIISARGKVVLYERTTKIEV